MVDRTLIFKKIDSTLAENYIPVSVLPTVSMVFEIPMQKQLNNYINKFLLPYFLGYIKEHSSQFALMTLIKKWKICLDRKRYTGAVLLIRFDTINHEILIAKYHAYGFSKDFLGIILSYLLNHCLCVKVNSMFSSWTSRFRTWANSVQYLFKWFIFSV